MLFDLPYFNNISKNVTGGLLFMGEGKDLVTIYGGG